MQMQQIPMLTKPFYIFEIKLSKSKSVLKNYTCLQKNTVSLNLKKRYRYTVRHGFWQVQAVPYQQRTIETFY